MEEESNEFLRVALRVSTFDDFQQIVQDQQSILEFSTFQIDKLLPEEAMKTYKRIQKKYSPPNEMMAQPEIWLESQKRLFAWFIVFQSYLSQQQTDIEHPIDFSKLSKVFFNKDPDFLLFHYLVMLKSSEKATWNQQIDSLLLDVLLEEGMKWNQISRRIFIKTNKLVFRSPKSCRERWLNHLDNTKVKGNWEISQDITIFQHVVETSSKKWSKMVSLLGNKRSEHSIKNRFNTLVAKHRKYKCEKDLKVAVRILAHLQSRTHLQHQKYYQNNQSHSQKDQLPLTFNLNVQNEGASEECKQDMMQAQIQGIKQKEKRKLLLQNFKHPLHNQKNQIKPQEQNSKVQKPTLQEKVISPKPDYTQGFHPFDNYSYENDIYSYLPSQIFDFHQTQLFFCQPVLTITLPTTDTTTRQTKILQERRRGRSGVPKS